MICITPIAGNGSRTAELGPYKPFIKVDGDNTILHYCIASSLEYLNTGNDLYCFICTEEQERLYNVTERITKICYSDFNVSFPVYVATIDSTAGQLETIYKGVQKINDFLNKHKPYDLNSNDWSDGLSPVILINSDQYNRFDFPWPSKYRYDIALGTYFENTGKSAYFNIEEDQIKGLAEKELISNYASSGLFIFRTFDILWSLMQTVDVNRLNKERKEDYISHCINKNIRSFRTIPISSKVKIDLGNVKQILKMREDPFIRIRKGER